MPGQSYSNPADLSRAARDFSRRILALESSVGIGAGAGGATNATAAAYAAQQAPWRSLGTSSFVQTPPNQGHNGAFKNAAAWASATAASLGEYKTPTTPNGYVYECMAGGTTHSSEPTWPTTLGDRVSDNGVIWECRLINVLSTNSDQSSVLVPGLPVRLTVGGEYRYGIIVASQSDKFAWAGAGVMRTESVTAVEYGRPDMVREIRVGGINANWSGGSPPIDLLAEDLFEPIEWAGPPAFLVACKLYTGVADGGGSDPIIVPTIGGTAVFRHNAGTGVTLETAETWTWLGRNSVDRTEYEVAFGDVIELSMTTAGGNGDADNLSAVLIFVME